MNAIGIVACASFVPMVAVIELARRWSASRRSGWHRLGQRYPAGRGEPRSAVVSGNVTINGRPCAFSPIVTIGAAGITLALRPILARAFHPAIFVPWDDVTVVLDDAVDGDLPLWAGGAGTIRLTGNRAVAARRVLDRRQVRRGAHRRG